MADVVTEVAPERRTGGGATPHGPRRGLQPAARNDAQFKTRAWSVSGVFHVMFSDCSGSQVTEAVESGSAGRGGCCTPLPRAGAPRISGAAEGGSGPSWPAASERRDEAEPTTLLQPRSVGSSAWCRRHRLS